MNSTISLTDSELMKRDAFMERILSFVSGTFNIFSIYLGDRLGLYRSLSEGGPATARELAARTGTHHRYIREWLEQQAVARIIDVQNEHLDAENRRYQISPGHGEVLIDCNSLNYMAPFAQLIAGVVHPLQEIVNAYRHGGGVPFQAYGVDLREGQGAFNCPAFTNQLAEEWLPNIPDLHTRLMSDPPARVADIGCGFGWSSIGIARGYPKVIVDGYDLDEPSIVRARQNAKINRVSERVFFSVRDASDPTLAGQYDLVTAFECLHDMSNPVGALTMMRKLASERGTVLVVDERVGEKFAVDGNEIDDIMYGFSMLHCLPVGMVEDNAAGTGTVMRPDTVRAYARQAGFSQVEILPIDNYFFRFYRLHA